MAKLASNKKIQAVIMAAGKSIRTQPLTLTRPKALLKVGNRTILEHTLDQLQPYVYEAIIIVGYKKEMITAFGSKYKRISLKYVEQKEQLGTGHALLQAEQYISGKFIAVNGDDLYSGKDMKQCILYKYSLLAKKTEDISNYGVIILNSKKGVRDIVEKPKERISDLANLGMYVLDKEIFSILRKIPKSIRGEYEIPDAIRELGKNNHIECVKLTDYWIPIVYSWNLLDANTQILSELGKSSIKGTVERGAVIKGNVIVGKGTIIKSGSYIEGPTIIGNDCKIGPNCYIRASTSIGNNCHIGQAVEIKNSIILDNSNIAHLSYVGDSVIGQNVNFGAGTIVANLKHDNSSIKSEVNGLLIDTKRRKLGTIAGDNVHTGINTSIYPGRKMWPNTITLPGQIVQKDITN